MTASARVTSVVIAVLGNCLCQLSLAAEGSSGFPSSEDSLKGDHIRLRTNINGFKIAGDKDGVANYCAPAGSRFAISNENETEVSGWFLSITSETDRFLDDDDRAALTACKANRVNTYSSYTLTKKSLGESNFRRTGVAFGALVVPFKFRLGGSKELVSSSTIAPFFGFRTGWWQSLGLTFTPVVAAGLSLVPVKDSGGNSTTTKAGYTVAAGVRLTSTKNDAFSAGLLFGKDYLNKADREADPAVNKAWVSFYLGYSI